MGTSMSMLGLDVNQQTSSSSSSSSSFSSLLFSGNSSRINVIDIISVIIRRFPDSSILPYVSPLEFKSALLPKMICNRFFNNNNNNNDNVNTSNDDDVKSNSFIVDEFRKRIKLSSSPQTSSSSSSFHQLNFIKMSFVPNCKDSNSMKNNLDECMLKGYFVEEKRGNCDNDRTLMYILTNTSSASNNNSIAKINSLIMLCMHFYLAELNGILKEEISEFLMKYHDPSQGKDPFKAMTGFPMKDEIELSANRAELLLAQDARLSKTYKDTNTISIDEQSIEFDKKSEKLKRGRKLLLALLGFDISAVRKIAEEEKLNSERISPNEESLGSLGSLGSTKTTKLTIQDVEQQFSIQRNLSNISRPNCLSFIAWEAESKHVYSNGTRSAPWRACKGDLAYIAVMTHDAGKLHITASQIGWYTNIGYFIDVDGIEKFSFDRNNDKNYKTLSELLSSTSPHYAHHIASSEISLKFSSSGDLNALSTVSSSDSKELISNSNSINNSRPSSARTRIASSINKKEGTTNSSKSIENLNSNSTQNQNAIRPSTAIGMRGESRNNNSLQHRFSNINDISAGIKIPNRPQSSRLSNRNDNNVNAVNNLNNTVNESDNIRNRKKEDSEKNRRMSAISTATATKAAPTASMERRNYINYVSQMFGNEEYHSDENLSDEEPMRSKKSLQSSELPPDYWKIQKIVKRLEGTNGNLLGTLSTLETLREFNMNDESIQLAMKDTQGLKVLVDLLSIEDLKCNHIAIYFLSQLLVNPAVVEAISDLHPVSPMLAMLSPAYIRNSASGFLPSTSSKSSSTTTIAIGNNQGIGMIKEMIPLILKCLKFICRNPSNRRQMRQCGGISRISVLMTSQDILVSTYAAEVMRSCSSSLRCRELFARSGAIQRLPSLLSTTISATITKRNLNDKSLGNDGIIKFLTATIAILRDCAKETRYRNILRDTMAIKPLIQILSFYLQPNEQKEDRSNDDKMIMSLFYQITEALMILGEDSRISIEIRKQHGLQPLITLLVTSLSMNNNNNNNSNETETDNSMSKLKLIEATTGAIWKCGDDIENSNQLVSLGLLPILSSILSASENNLSDIVLYHVAGAIWNCARTKQGSDLMNENDVIDKLIKLFGYTNPLILTNAARAIGTAAKTNPKNLGLINKFGGIRLLWSLLKIQTPMVQAAAAYALCPCIDNTNTSASMVRSFVGGLQILLELLSSPCIEVVSSVCATIASISSDFENLNVISDHLVMLKLIQLLATTLRYGIANERQKSKKNKSNVNNGIDEDEDAEAKDINNIIIDDEDNKADENDENDEDDEEKSPNDIGIDDVGKDDNAEMIELKTNLANAIAGVAQLEKNRIIFCELGGIKHLVSLLNSSLPIVDLLMNDSSEVVNDNNIINNNNSKLQEHLAKYQLLHRSVAGALFALSKNDGNCIDMFQVGAVRLLTPMCGSHDDILQEFAAGAISNVRKVITRANYM